MASKHKNETADKVAINYEWYGFLQPKLDEFDLNDMWFQQNSSICHTISAKEV